MIYRVRLSLLERRDEAPFLAAVAASRALHRPWVKPPATSDAFRLYVKRAAGPDHYALAVRHADTGALVGLFALSNIVRGVFLSAYLGYYGFAGHTRQGLMHEGLDLTLRFAFRSLRLHRLEANIQPDNAPSIALVRSCGFAKEGFSPKYLKIRGRWRDHERWARLAR